VNTGDDHHLVSELAEAVAASKPVALATVVATKRSVPRRAGTKMLIYRDGTLSGTVGGGDMESRVIEAARESMRSGKTQMLLYSLLEPSDGDPGVCGGEVQIYLEPYMPAHTIFVIGAGHVGRAVVDLAHWLGYRTVITDDREDMVSEEHLPHADVRLSGSVVEALAKEEVTENTSVILVSRATDIDADAIPRLLDTPAMYIGVMGSRRRWMTVRDEMLAKGINEKELDRIHQPIGVELGAETLQEIAVSILAQVIQVIRTGTSGEDHPD
jgi:xanthine dehydrogenase accessory factor